LVRRVIQPPTPTTVVMLEETMPPLSVLRLEYSDGASECGSAGKVFSVLESRAPSVRSIIPLCCDEM
jgi:hypothetical protein